LFGYSSNPTSTVDPDGRWAWLWKLLSIGTTLHDFYDLNETLNDPSISEEQKEEAFLNFWAALHYGGGGLGSLKKGGKVLKVTNDGKYIPAPKTHEGFEGLRRAKPKTPVQGGGGLRKRWVDDDGYIYEWDSQHGTVEKYNKRGKHLGEFDAKTGNQINPPNSDPTFLDPLRS
jgi:hypothetical protein